MSFGEQVVMSLGIGFALGIVMTIVLTITHKRREKSLRYIPLKVFALVVFIFWSPFALANHIGLNEKLFYLAVGIAGGLAFYFSGLQGLKASGISPDTMKREEDES